MTNDLNEYEWRAYRALLAADSLSAYELGKASGIPLSRCYEVARALAAKGCALVQPGETPRYRAVEPDELVARERRALEHLGEELRALRAGRGASKEPVWVVRGREAILVHAAAMVDRARTLVDVRIPPQHLEPLADAVADARARGVAVETRAAGALVLLVDGAEALLGELDPPESCLATHLTQPAVVALLAEESQADWLAWEESKVRRLLRPIPDVA